MALAALFVALGGTGYAAGVAHDSVASRAIKNNSIRSVDVRDDALTGSDINESSLTIPGGLSGPAGPKGNDGAPGAPGTTGQSVTTAAGTGQLQVTSATAYTPIPGLTQTLNVPADATVYVTTDGGIQSTSSAAGGFSVVDVGLFVDGNLSSQAGQRRIEIANSATLAQQIGNWSFGRAYSLSAGSHTFETRATGVDPGMATANVSSASAPQLQGTLTVMVLKQ